MNKRNMLLVSMLALPASVTGCGLEENGEWIDVRGAQEAALEASPLRGYVHTSGPALLREGPSVDSPLSRDLSIDARVFVEEGPIAERWYQVVDSTGTRGFVEATSLQKWPAQLIYQMPTEEKVVSLTFDAGADRGYAAEILDVLAAHQLQASFGITGRWAEANPDLVARMDAEGHQLVNHSWSHGSFTGFSPKTAPLSYEERALELWRTHAMTLSIGTSGTKPFFRPPFGDLDASVLTDVYSRGYPFIAMWTCDSLGWRGLSAEEIVQRAISFATPGAIYLFHVGEQSADAAALPDIIRELSRLGYRFARVSDYVPARPSPVVTSAWAGPDGVVYATVDGQERVIASDGAAPLLIGTRAVAYRPHASEGELPVVSVFHARSEQVARFPFHGDSLHSLTMHDAGEGRTALIAVGTAGARAVPVLAIYDADLGVVFEAGPATVESVSGDEIVIRDWERQEGDLEVSPAGTRTFSLSALLEG